MFADLRYRLRALFDRGSMDRELDEELRFHVEREAEKYQRAGFLPDEAMRRARLSFGGIERIKEESRDSRGIMTIDSLRQDLRFAWRGLISRPGFAAAIVVTLGLGIGANAAMFGIVDRLLFRPAPYLADADHTHRIYLRYQATLGERIDRNLEYTRYADLVRWMTSFDRIAAFAYRQSAIGTGDEAREMTVAAVSGNFFEFFAIRPALGRFFLPDEDRTPTGAHVAVLSHPFWQTRFGGAHDVLGKSVRIGDQTYLIVGVAPEGFVGMIENRSPAAFLPITTVAYARSKEYYTNYNWSWLELLARRKRGVSVAAADADVSSAFVQSWNAERLLSPSLPTVEKARPRGEIAPIHMGRGPQAAREVKVATWVMGVAAVVLLVACANVVNLLLARAVQRRREVAVRLALGVTRRRLVQQLLTESLLLAILGGVVGMLLAQWGGQVLRTAFLESNDSVAVFFDARTLLFATAVTLMVAVVTGLAPLAYSRVRDVSASLKSGTREGTYNRSRLRTFLLVFQAALSVVLLVGAGLFVRSLANVTSRRLGYDVEPVVFAEANMRGAALPDAEQNALNQRLELAARSVPGVVSASRVISVPFWSNEGRGAPSVPGVDSTQKLGQFLLQAGSPSYFETVGTRIVRGRAFTEHDRAGAPRVLVVTENMAAALWPGQDPIGKVLRIGRDTTPFSTVIGVAENMQGRLFQGDTEFWYFMPIAQYESFYGRSDPSIFARVRGDAADHQETLRRSLQRELPGDAYVNTNPLATLVTPQQRSWRFGATMFVAFGGLALLLAAIGLYSVIAYAVAQRTHELGVRIALGASVGHVVRLIMSQALTFATAGIVIGAGVALWAGKFLEPLLYAQPARDPTVYALVAVVLLVVAAGASLRPALRATRVDPSVALRAE
jgi:putative ABC transport system permease protein